MNRPALNRRRLLYLLGCLPLVGCTALGTSESNGSAKKASLNPLKSLAAERKLDLPDRVGEAAWPFGVNWARVQAVALLTQLKGTGGKPEPGRQRDDLIHEIRTHNIENVNQFVDSPNTAMAIIDATVPPGARKGDAIDLKIIPSVKTSATSFRGGWLMPWPLREMRVLDGAIKTSDILGHGTGAVVTRWDIEGGEDPQKKLEGVVVGGGVLSRARNIGLYMRRIDEMPLDQRVTLASTVSEAINSRFSLFDGLKQRGVANAKSDELIELDIQPAYLRAVRRYVAVIDRIPISNEGPKRAEQLEQLRAKLVDPATAADAALSLEAFGREDAKSILVSALVHPDPVVRFVAAEALAFLGDERAVAVLTESARTNPDMRYNALRALSIHDHHTAGDALASLMHDPSNELRYGALRELRERGDYQSHLATRMLPGDIELVLVPTTAPPLVAVSTSKRPLIALFGAPIAVRGSTGRNLGDGLSVRSDGLGRLRINLYRAENDDQVQLTPADLEGFLAGLCQLGVTYGTLVASIRQLKEAGDIDARLAFDPLPKVDNQKLEAPMTALRGDAELDQKISTRSADSNEPSYAWWDARGWF